MSNINNIIRKKNYSMKKGAVYNRKWREKNLDHVREYNRKQAKKHRKSDTAKTYFKDYFKQWYRVGNNARIHIIRTRIATIKHALLHKPNVEFRDLNQTILNNLYAIGWNENIHKKMCVNHKVSVKILVAFDKTITDDIICSRENMEVIEKRLNNSAEYRTVDDRVIATAELLEKTYKLKGLTKFVSKLKGELI